LAIQKAKRRNPVKAFLLAQNGIGGQVFNIGGGPANTTSLLELLTLIGEPRGRALGVRFDVWRPADQRYHVPDTRTFSASTGKARAGRPPRRRNRKSR
jgi:CDP-paratose 2-epimerase